MQKANATQNIKLVGCYAKQMNHSKDDHTLGNLNIIL